MTTQAEKDKIAATVKATEKAEAAELAKSLVAGLDEIFLGKLTDALLQTGYEFGVQCKFETRERALFWVAAAYERASK